MSSSTSKDFERTKTTTFTVSAIDCAEGSENRRASGIQCFFSFAWLWEKTEIHTSKSDLKSVRPASPPLWSKCSGEEGSARVLSQTGEGKYTGIR